MDYIVLLKIEKDANRFDNTGYDTLAEFKGILTNDGIEYEDILLLWDFTFRYNEGSLNKDLFIAHIKTVI